MVERRFVGVCRYQAKWWAYAYVQRQKITFGGYYTEEEAAKAVDRALIYMAGHCTSPSSICCAAYNSKTQPDTCVD